MTTIETALGGMGSLILALASGLLFEELTVGALVKLIVAPRARTHSAGASKGPANSRPPR